MCLLDMLVARGEYELTVAHVDHGIREDSVLDRQLVESLAKKHALNIVITKLNISNNASEDVLRQARYSFLFEQMHRLGAQAILTAHHADDLLETSIMNVQRGTDRYGAAGGMTREGIERPLMNVRKSDLLTYATEHNLVWREDSTNQDIKYARNKIRHEVIPNIDTAKYQEHLTQLGDLNNKIDSELQGLVSIENQAIVLSSTTLSHLGLRELEVLLAYAIRQIDPSIELKQPQIARQAREILLDTTKNSFSYVGAEGIIIEIQ